MKYLRTVSTSRLLASITGVVLAIAGGTAIAVAATSGGPVPPARPLSAAIHDALGGQAPAGISADITFTNGLITSSDLPGGPSDPLLTGASGRLWASQGAIRLELQSDNGDAQVVYDHGKFWAYDPSSKTVYEGNLGGPGAAKDKAGAAKDKAGKDKSGGGIPSLTQIQSFLTKLAQHANVSAATPTDIGGAPAYTVRISPKHDGGLLGAAQLAWDATNGVPLDFAVYAAGNSTPVIELKATNVSFGAIPASTFEIAPPNGAHVVHVSLPKGASASSARSQLKRHLKLSVQKSRVHGLAAVASHLKFHLVAPAKLDGLPRRSVQLLDFGGSPSALVLYGQNLGGVAVLEHAAGKGGANPLAGGSSSGDSKGLTLPSVSINGATGKELDTPLGTVLTFTRAGIDYVVAGSVPPVAAEAAARAL